MAEHKKLSMLVKLDDGQTYTLGGDGADNAVTLDTEQTITGLKTFDKLPQSSVEPKADADLITKGYADGHYLPVDTKPHKYDILVKMKHDGTSWVGFSDFSVRLRDGTRLDIKHIENQSATTATQPVKAVFKTVKDLKAPIEAPKQQAATFFDSYKLEAGEFTGAVSFYKAAGKFNPASRDINPWYVYVGNGNANNYDGIYAVSIDNLDKPLLGVNFKFGDAHNSDTYTCTQCGVVFTVDGSALEVAYDGDMSNAFETTIEYPINAQSMIGVVKVDNAQEITGAKTFTQNVTVTAKPKEATDVATVGYVSGLLNAKAPYDVTLDFKVKDDTDGGWVVYSNMEINLDNGKKLKCIHIDNTQPTSASAPVKAVFKAIPATEAINAAPTEQAPTFFDTYQLQDEEYLGTLTYGHILNSQLQDYASYKGPFHTNQYGTTCTIKEATQLRITISELPAAVSKVSLQFASSYLPKTFKASLSGVGMDVTSNVLTNPSGNTPLELLFDVVKLTGLVTLDTAQTITGAKTFETLPSSKTAPKKSSDLVNKSYVDKLKYPPATYTMTLFMKPRLQNYQGISEMIFRLQSGASLKPLYIESTDVATAKKSKIIYEITYDAMPAAIKPQRIEASALEKHLAAMQDNWVEGTIEYAPSFHPDIFSESAVIDPFECYVPWCSGQTDTYYKFLKFTFKGLEAPLSAVDAKIGSNMHDETRKPNAYKCTLSTLSASVNSDEHDVSAMPDDSPITIKFKDELSTLMYLDKAQEVTALKTFKVLPQSEAVPADDKDLVNKKYVDEKVGAGGGTGGAAPANMVTTDTAQNITEVKTFDKLPKSSAIPNADDDLINRLYATQTFVPLGVTTKVDIHFGSNNGNYWIGWDKLQIRLRDNSRLDVKYIEDVFKNEDRRPIRVVFTTVKNFSDPVTVHELKSIDFLNSYKLEAGEYFGYLTYGYGISGNSFNSSSRMDTPWTLMLFRMVNDKSNTVVRFEIEQLDKELKCIYFRIADGYSDGRQLYADSCQITYATAFGSTAVPYNGPFTYGTEVTVDLPENDPNVMKGYVVTIRSLEARIKALEDAAPKP